MKKSQVVAFLRLPAKELVDLAVDKANLTKKEHLVIDICARKGATQQDAAETMDVSVDVVQKWYTAGMQKLLVAFSDCWWIQKIIGDA